MTRPWRHQHPANIMRHEERSAGDRVADGLASFVGSWTFVIGQSAILAVWVVVNTLTLFHQVRFDSFPFVFMNLFMSAEAAFATPVILMSQNRQTEHDRIKAEHDYETNEQALTEIVGNTAITRAQGERIDALIAELRAAREKA